MGTIVLATHLDLGTSVAIKLLRKELSQDRESVARFSREALATASLGTAHVVRIFDAGRLEDGQPYLVMEFLEGRDLGAELARRGRIPYREAIAYVIEACRGVSEAHRRGIVHRDLKPANLFLAEDRGRRVVKVLDFGISHMDVPEEVRMTQTQSAFGTPLYMSPEAIRSARLTDSRTDVWALGVILYELVVGAPPFLGESATAVAVAATVEPFVPVTHRVAGVPTELDAVLDRALSKSADGRFRDAGELCAALEAIHGTPPAEAASTRGSAVTPEPRRPQGFPEESDARARPRGSVGKALLLLFACIVIGAGVTVGLAALFLRFGRPRSSSRTPAGESYVLAAGSDARSSIAPAPSVEPAPSAEPAPLTPTASAIPAPSEGVKGSPDVAPTTTKKRTPVPASSRATPPTSTTRSPTTPPLHL